MDDDTPPGERYGYPEHWEADVVLRDGGTAHIRPIRPDDAERLVEFYAEVSDESKYFRFFAPYPRLSDRDVHRFTHHDYVDRVGLAATVGDEFIATVRFDRLDGPGAPGDAAEVAFLVQDAQQGRGVASALLEHISAAARERGIRRFIAEVLPQNRKMIKVFTDAGYQQKRSFGDGVVSLELDLEPTDTQIEVMRAREHRAEARSVQRLLNPRSVAVIGAGRTPGGFGRTVLRNVVAAGFPGAAYAVNRAFAGVGDAELEGVPAFGSVADVPGPIDLAVVAVPADEVLAVAADCGARGVQGLVVVSSGWAEAGAEGLDRQRELVRVARAHGMRVVGPNALGIVNTDPAVRLNASLAPQPAVPGGIGLFAQSPAIAVAALAFAGRRGLGLSSFVSAGNRADVSGNDLLQYWEEDDSTDVAVLHLESFGNPRKFTRLARRLGRRKPVVVVKSGRHPGLVPASHAVPAAQISDETVDTLFRQAGVVRVDTLNELWDAAELLHHQPLPGGDRVAVVGNSESIGLLTRDACLAAGLQPVGSGPAADGDAFGAALREAVESPANDAVLAVAVPSLADAEGPVGPMLGPPAGADPALLLAAVTAAADRARELGKPLVLVHMAYDGLSELLRGYGAEGSALRTVPAYPAPERAAKSLAEAARYAAWRRADAESGRVPDLDGLDEPAARAIVDAALTSGMPPASAGTSAGSGDGAPLRDAGDPTGAEEAEGAVLLDDRAAANLLAAYGITVWPALPAPSAEAAADAARLLGYPVALKTTAPHLRHRADLGGVRLDIPDEAELRRAFDDRASAFGGADAARLAVQAMAPRGVPTVLTATDEPAVGAVLSFGLAGAPAELLGDTAHRLVPATDREVAALVRSVRAAPLLFGWRGADPVDTDALEELLLRLSVLVHDLPEAVSVHLEPVVVGRRGVAVLGAEVRLAPAPARTDLGPRTLRGF